MRTCGRCSKAGSPPCCSAVRPGGRATGWPGAWTASGLEVRDQELLHGLVELELVLVVVRSEEHTSELQSQSNLVCRLLLEKKKNKYHIYRENTHKYNC